MWALLLSISTIAMSMATKQSDRESQRASHSDVVGSSRFSQTFLSGICKSCLLWTFKRALCENWDDSTSFSMWVAVFSSLLIFLSPVRSWCRCQSLIDDAFTTISCYGAFTIIHDKNLGIEGRFTVAFASWHAVAARRRRRTNGECLDRVRLRFDSSPCIFSGSCHVDASNVGHYYTSRMRIVHG